MQILTIFRDLPRLSCATAQQVFSLPFLILGWPPFVAHPRLFVMLEKQNAERVGNYVVTPLTRTTDAGVTASVSIRRGVYDRIFRFIPAFACHAQAAQYALAQGRSMVLQNQLS